MLVVVFSLDAVLGESRVSSHSLHPGQGLRQKIAYLPVLEDPVVDRALKQCNAHHRCKNMNVNVGWLVSSQKAVAVEVKFSPLFKFGEQLEEGVVALLILKLV